jgi:mono/diheme cytochrome c family protein
MPQRALLLLLLLSTFGCGQSPSSACPSDEQGACPATALTYDSGIGALLTQRCSPCHAPRGDAGRLLTDYPHAFGQRTGIGTQLVSCSMPPAGAPQLSDAERKQILDWLTCGAPQ